MATWYPLEDYTEEQYLDTSIAEKRQELETLRAQIEAYKKTLNELHDILDAAPEALIYNLRFNVETMTYENPDGQVTWVVGK